MASSTITTASPFPNPNQKGEKTTLVTLPAEIHLEIFGHLPLVSSTCLGLTCKKLHNIHHDLHGKAPLETRESYQVEESTVEGDLHLFLQTWTSTISAELHLFLRPWMYKSAKLVWGGEFGLKFITVERREREKKERDEVDRADTVAFKEGEKKLRAIEAGLRGNNEYFAEAVRFQRIRVRKMLRRERMQRHAQWTDALRALKLPESGEEMREEGGGWWTWVKDVTGIAGEISREHQQKCVTFDVWAGMEI